MPADTTPTVYLMGEIGPDACEYMVKIGIAKNVHARRREVQTGNARPLVIEFVIPGGIELERHLHSWFARYRRTGEWFKDEDGLIRAFFRKNGMKPKPPVVGRPWRVMTKKDFAPSIPEAKLNKIRDEIGNYSELPISPKNLLKTFKLTRMQAEHIVREELWRRPRAGEQTPTAH